MLEMSCRLAVACTDAPTISAKINVSFTHRNHGLDGDTHSCLQHDTIATTSIVWNRRVFVHLVTDTMTCKLSDHSVAFSLTIVLYGSSYISHVLTCHGILDAFEKRFPCYLKQLANFVRNFANTECISRVTVESVEKRTTINGDNISLFQYCFLAGNAMHHYIIN